MGLFGCNQETPAEKAKAAAASGNTATQAAGQAEVDAIKTPMDQASQTESVLGQSAEQRAAQSTEPTQSRGEGWPGWPPVLTEPPR